MTFSPVYKATAECLDYEFEVPSIGSPEDGTEIPDRIDESGLYPSCRAFT